MMEGSVDRRDDQLFEPILGEVSPKSKTLSTVLYTGLYLGLVLIYGLSVIVVALTATNKCDAYFVLIYIRIGKWILAFVLDNMLKYKHEQHRLFGYHELHRSTRLLRGLPFTMATLWNIVIMGVQTFMQHYYGPDFLEHCRAAQLFTPIGYLAAFSVPEMLFVAIVIGSYIKRVYEFNRTLPQPDALRENNDWRESIGFSQRAADVADLLEKQADLIDFYKEQLLRQRQSATPWNQPRTIPEPESQSSEDE